ncbi:MAG TPA: bifunctional adenosylcobinamide kinase/adenosylcobinamide-phosphate guanylyltransferase [Candidatus Treponema faecavium]|nr:bifunctional adenosylcobinamide kinase/adenosylcobinamide-phosphate guanylyltransferase [Candidatus Treponema faecavium]
MILVTGGYGSGRKTFVRRELGMHDGDIDSCAESACAVFIITDSFALRFMQAEEAERERLVQLVRQKKAVICSETGCGVIPAEQSLCTLREAHGLLNRVCALYAETVIRMCCGIAVPIKGSVPT